MRWCHIVATHPFGRCCSRKTGKAYLGTTPSKRSIKRICDAISAETGQHTKTISAEKMVKRLNFKLSGWANYFHLGPVSKAYQVVEGLDLGYRNRHRSLTHALMIFSFDSDIPM
jgi:hypothetical protein